MQARSIQVNGIVQGVGFRPFVARTARSAGLTGWVLNSPHGVDIAVQGEPRDLDEFERRLVDEMPAAALVLDLRSTVRGPIDADRFEIRASEHDASRDTLVSPDLATCDDCLAELFDPEDRRYHYPFVNCTNCGPRFTIIEDLPYDRPVTSMGEFEMCPQCAAEYADEDDRRYHAQPDACFTCGPHLWWHADGKTRHARGRDESDAVVAQAAERLKRGDVLAVKGLGGWHLVCDACNEQAVERLRIRKRRPSKPLAVMVKDLDMARMYCEVDSLEAELLFSPARPIVLLIRNIHQENGLAAGIAGMLPEIGTMLPSTPVQHLLMDAFDGPLVMTSGNRSGEPIVADDDEALEALGGIADGFLGNDRRIVSRYDDSVVRVLEEQEVQMVRRARGYAPRPLFVDGPGGPAIFAAGPEQKSTFTFLQGDRAYISQHLGDLERLGAWQAWDEARERYRRLFDVQPEVLACDLHPEYLAGKWARQRSRELGLPLVEVQHHHAHIASVLAENHLDERVIGLAIDGTGYGDDGSIWGCEVLLADRAGYERFWHLPTFQLPGGAAAIRDPRRTAYAMLRAFGELDEATRVESGLAGLALDEPQWAPFLDSLEERELLDQMLDKKINSPACSSLGRLFDGVSALLGACTAPSYDGEAACLLEAAARDELAASAGQRGARPAHGADVLDASGFHSRIAAALVRACARAREESGIEKVALGGGCMANRLLAYELRMGLADEGFAVYENHELPPNDGCVSYGQAVVARARLVQRR